MAMRADERLRKRGLKVTAPRLAVLRAVEELAGHPDAAAIAAHARVHLGSVSTQAVYDGLHALEAVGLVRRIQPAGSSARYETRVGDNHHHLICRACGSTVDVDCARGGVPRPPAPAAAGYEVDEAEVIYWGRCPECVAATTGPQPTTTR